MTESWPAELERGLAGAPLAGEARSGDVAVFAPTGRGGLLCVIDGLGHGDEAADAAEAAAAVVRAAAVEVPQVLLERCHAALATGRGVVMTLAWFDLVRRALTWTGVGNVEGRLVRARGGLVRSALVFAGVVGYRLPRVKPQTEPLAAGDVVALVTDGIAPGFSASLEPGVPAQELADRLHARHGRTTDDALAAVVRYAP